MRVNQTTRRPTEADYFDVLPHVLSPAAFRAILERAVADATDGDPAARAWLFPAMFESPLRIYANRWPGATYDLTGITAKESEAFNSPPSTPTAALEKQVRDRLLKEAREEPARRKATEPANKESASPEATQSSGPASGFGTETSPRNG